MPKLVRFGYHMSLHEARNTNLPSSMVDDVRGWVNTAELAATHDDGDFSRGAHIGGGICSLGRFAP